MHLHLLRATRNNAIKIMRGLTDEQLNHIPEGFNNNLIWNAGHMIATMELLTYGLSGRHTPSDKAFVNRYRKGTRPETAATSAEIEEIFSRLKTSVTKLEEDLEKGGFENFKQYKTSFGVGLNDIREALEFNTLHEAMHLGSMIALRKFV